MLAEPWRQGLGQRARLLHEGEPSSLALATVVPEENLIGQFHEFRLAGNVMVACRCPSDELDQDCVTLLTWQSFVCLQNALRSLGHDSTFPLSLPSVKLGFLWA